MNNPDPLETPEEAINEAIPNEDHYGLEPLPPHAPNLLQIPTELGPVTIPKGLTSDDFDRLLAALELYRTMIVCPPPEALPTTSLPADYSASDAKAAVAAKRKASTAKKKTKKPPPVSSVIAPMSPATPAVSTEGRQIDEDGYLMDRTPG